MDNNLIVIRQLPVIEDQLRQIKSDVEKRVSVALSLVCTEETRQTVKEARSSLNKEFAELEARRKEVKAAIMAPYDEFEALYKECAADIYRDADAQLKARISEVENDLKRQKLEKVEAYFNEYRQSLSIPEDYVSFRSANINITLNASDKSLKSAAKSFLDRVYGDLSVIDKQEFKDEILVEYLTDLDLAGSVNAVVLRHKAIAAEQERRRAEENQMAARDEAERRVEQIAAEDAPITSPTAEPVPEAEAVPSVNEPVYSTSFKVTGTMDQLRALKNFLITGGYVYEQL